MRRGANAAFQKKLEQKNEDELKGKAQKAGGMSGALAWTHSTVRAQHIATEKARAEAETAHKLTTPDHFSSSISAPNVKMG